MALPLFPLSTVLFPDGILPLRIFERRYLDMVKECARHEGEFVVCLIKNGNEVGQAAQHYKVGTACQIIDWETLPDGLLGVTTQGVRRVQINDTQTMPDQLQMGEIETISEEQDEELPARFSEWAQLLQEIIIKLGKPFDQQLMQLTSAKWVGARLTEVLPIEADIKQRVLEIDQPLVRLEHLRESLKDIEYYYSRGNLNH